MNEKVVDLFHEVIDVTIIVVPNPREKVVDGFFQRVFEVRSKRYAFERTVSKALDSKLRRTRL